MVYAQFYTIGAVTGKVIEGCGDRSVLILDGRRTYSNMLNDCRVWCREGKLDWNCFRLFTGSSFTRSVPYSISYELKKEVKDESIS